MRNKHTPTFSLVAELMASPTQPLSLAVRTEQLTKMWQALRALEIEATPTKEDWRVLADTVNLMETLLEMGEVNDSGNLLKTATTAMVMACRRTVKGYAIRLDAAGMMAIRSVLEDYAAVIEQLPARTMVRCHRLTERRIRATQSGRRVPGVEVVDL